MPTAVNPYDYQPVPVSPPGGLLASAVGTPQAPQPPIDPNTYENDDVVSQLNAITAADSGYMQLARTSGLQTANKRGLLNTSIAAGASQAAALAAAAPLASQNASQAAARNQTRLGAFFTGKQQEADITSREQMLHDQLASEETRLGRQLTSQEKQQQTELASQKYLQQQQLASTERVANLNIKAESDRLGRTLTAQETAQQRELAAQSANLQTQVASQQTIAQLEQAGATSRANLDAATRLQLEQMSNLSEQQKATLSYYLAQDQIYAQGVSSVYANADLPAPSRDQAISLFGALKNSGVDLPATLFGLDLSWGTTAHPTVPPSAVPPPVPAPVTPVAPAAPAPVATAPAPAAPLIGARANIAANRAARGIAPRGILQQ